MIIKSIVERNVEGRLHIIGKQIKGYDGIIRQTLIRYLSHYSEMEKQTLSDRIINQEPELETDMRTVAQQWIDEGVTLGEQKGIEKGIEKGIAKVALNLLDEKADIALVAKATGLTESQLITLKSRYTIH